MRKAMLLVIVRQFAGWFPNWPYVKVKICPPQPWDDKRSSVAVS